LGYTKYNSATEVAHHGRLQIVAQLVERFPLKENVVGSNPAIYYKSKDYFDILRKASNT
jgi:hypothetical protein